jgi:DNA-3-methyladenine glycosylase I
MKTRCVWPGTDPLYTIYHDSEWGVPLHDDRKLFECIVLQGAQAGLSWLTVLKKRGNYRKAFDHFDPYRVNRYNPEKVTQLLTNKGIIRNKRKIDAAINNAAAFIKIQKRFGSFDAYIWRFVGGEPIKNAWKQIEDIPDKTAISGEMSHDLKKRGFRFVGPTICYAFMQAAGMVNDHVVDCFRYHEL